MKKIIPLIFTLCLSLPVFSQNHAPTAVNDYVVTKRGHVIVDILANDFDVDGDSINILFILPPNHGRIIRLSDREIEYTAFPSYRGGLDSIRYKLMDNGSPVLSSYGYVIFDVDNPLSFDSVAVNNIQPVLTLMGFYLPNTYAFLAQVLIYTRGLASRKEKRPKLFIQEMYGLVDWMIRIPCMLQHKGIILMVAISGQGRCLLLMILYMMINTKGCGKLTGQILTTILLTGSNRVTLLHKFYSTGPEMVMC